MSFGFGLGFPRRVGEALRASAAFNFLSGVLDPRITFSRTTNATLIGSDGTLQYAPHNLLTYSEQFDNAAWIKNSVTINANSIAAPDGTTTAEKLVETAVANEHTALQQTNSTAGVTFTLSLYAKKAERDYVVVSFGSGFTGTPTRAWFDLTNGTVGTLVNSPTASIVSLGNGWYRCSISKTATVFGSSGNCLINVATGDNVLGYTGDGVSGLYVWGAQLNVGALQPYYSTTVKNLLGYSQEFDNAAWSKVASSIATNLLTYSEQFDNAAWTKAQSTITSNSVVAPDGTTTADKLVEDATLATHFTSQSYSNSNALLTFSIYIKAAERSIVRLQLSNNSTGAAAAFFDASNGTISSAASDGGDFTGSTATITAVGNGWYRCSLTTLKGAVNTTAWPYVALASTGTTTSYTGDGTSGIYVWGAQLVQSGAAETYQRTGATIRPIGYTAPDGSLTADKLVADISTGPHYITPSPALSLVVGQVLTYSVYAKAAERTFLQLILTGVGAGPTNLIAGFDLVAGVAGTPSAGSTSSIVAVGNGWYRCGITTPIATAGTPTQQIRVAQNSSSTPSSYTGDGTSGIYIWGAQFSDSASLDPYFYNPAAAPSNTAYYGPRFDYDPVTLAAKGLLIEEQRTNSIRNNTMQGAVTGTPGTLPTNWAAFTALTGLTREVVGTGTETGISYIDIRLSGTPSAAGTYSLLDEASNGVAALTGQAWTHSLFVALAAGSTTGVSSITTVFEERTSANAFLAEQTSTAYTITTTALGGTRQSKTATTNGGATTAFLNAYFRITLTGAAIDITLRIGMPQLELGAFATSVIPTTTTALTRAADVASVTGANFSSWFNSAQGTMLVEAQQPVIFAASKTAASFTDGTNNNRFTLYRQAAGGINAFSNPGGVVVSSGLTATANVTWKSALAYSVSPASFSANGITPLSLPYTVNTNVFTELSVGNSVTGGLEHFNGHIRSFKYYPTRLSNGQLQSLTVLPLWTPAALGASLALWLDANDASTITLNGSNVSQWGDKSGNGRNAVQATAATQPVYSATSFNGKPTLTWDGIDDAMQISMSLPATDINLFAVLAPDVATQADYILDIPTVRRVFSTSGQIFSGSWLPSAAPITAGGQRLYGFTTGPANQITYSDGTAISTIAALPAAVVDGSVGLGNRNISGGSFGLDGDMSELVFVSGTLSTLDRQKLEGYLAWKWGLQANLPVGHPYKDAPPTV